MAKKLAVVAILGGAFTFIGPTPARACLAVVPRLVSMPGNPPEFLVIGHVARRINYHHYIVKTDFAVIGRVGRRFHIGPHAGADGLCPVLGLPEGARVVVVADGRRYLDRVNYFVQALGRSVWVIDDRGSVLPQPDVPDFIAGNSANPDIDGHRIESLTDIFRFSGLPPDTALSSPRIGWLSVIGVCLLLLSALTAGRHATGDGNYAAS